VAILFGALIMVGLLIALQLQLDQQIGRARTLKAFAQGWFLARQGLEKAALELKSTGRIAASGHLSEEGGEIDVFAEGPRPAGTRKHIVFSRARFGRNAVLMIADLDKVKSRAIIANVQVLYQDLDVSSAAVRAQLIAQRGRTLKTLIDTVRAYRTEGAGLSSRLSIFLESAADGQIPSADRALIGSSLPTTLTTCAP